MTRSLFDDLPEPPVELLPFDGSAVLHRGALSGVEADAAFRELAETVEWDQPTLLLYGREVLQPRLSAWFGELEAAYSYSGLTLRPTLWTPLLTKLRRTCEALAGAPFNAVLANLYRDGADSVAWHADDEAELGFEPVIASLSLGAERRFDLRHVESGETVRSMLPAGSVVIMSGASQHLWRHQVPKTKRPVGPRINLTFRTIN